MTQVTRVLVCCGFGLLLGTAGCVENAPPQNSADVKSKPPVSQQSANLPSTESSEATVTTKHSVSRSVDSVPTGSLPFSIELGEPFTIDGVPGLHSFAQASTTIDGNTKWLFVGGRTGGLHAFVAPTNDNPTNAFEPTDANANLIVIDIKNRLAKSVPINTLAAIDPPLPTTINTEPWKSSNAMSCQVGDKLYLVGGYGYSKDADTTGKMVTFSTLSRMNVSEVIDAVWNQKSIAGTVAQLQDPRLKITGGEMLPVATTAQGQSLAIAFGQSFDGLYSVDVNQTDRVFQQKYSEVIKTFTVTDQPLSIAQNMGGSDVFASLPNSFVGQPTPDTIDGFSYLDFMKQRPYHRRDLNVFPAISPSGQMRIGVYGGVFRPGSFDGYVSPIYFDQVATISYDREGVTYSYQTFSPGTDHQFEQLLSQYHCAGLPVHDPQTGLMVTIFFGGISNYRYDADQNRLIKDPLKLSPSGRPIVDGVPFIDTVSALVHRSDATSAGYILPIKMPGYLGAEAEFLVDPSLPHYDNNVLQLDKITQPTVIGYIYGGIEAFGPYTGELEDQGRKPSSVASNKFIPVTLKPGSWTVKPMPQKPDEPQR